MNAIRALALASLFLSIGAFADTSSSFLGSGILFEKSFKLELEDCAATLHRIDGKNLVCQVVVDQTPATGELLVRPFEKSVDFPATTYGLITVQITSDIFGYSIVLKSARKIGVEAAETRIGEFMETIGYTVESLIFLEKP